MVSPLSENLRNKLIREYIGEIDYNTQKDKLKRREMMKKGLQAWKKRVINEQFKGSNYQFNLFWAKRQGFKTYKEYQNHLANQRGFKSHYEWEKHKRKLKGISEKENRLKTAQRHGCKTYSEYCYVKRNAKLLLANKKIEHFKERIKKLEEENKLLKERLK